MFHVDNPTGVPVMPPVAAELSKTTLYFTEGGNGIPPTYPGPDWFNIIQSELLEILRQANIKPDKNTTDQIMTALKKLFITNSGSAGAIAGLTGENNTFPYFTGEDTMALTPLSAFVRSILGKESATDFADALKVIKQSGGTMTGELKIRGVNALRIFNDAFGLIFRRSEECLHLIPTSEGQGENGDIGPLRPFTINLRTGEISMSHKVSVGGGSRVNGALGIGVQNALGGNSIAFGDNDTGIKQNGDGILDVYANGQHVFRFQNGVATALKNIQAGNAKKFTLSSANNSTKNATFNLWGNSSRPVVAELGDDSGWHFYSQRNTDNSITFAVNGQMVPSNYGNFDARYQTKTGGVQDVRLGSAIGIGRGGNAPSGHLLSGVDGGESVDWANARPVQVLINGVWRNVASL